MSVQERVLQLEHEGPGVRDLVKRKVRLLNEDDFQLVPPQLSEIILENSIHALELSDSDLLIEILMETDQDQSLVLTPPHDENDTNQDFVREGSMASVYWGEIRQNQKSLESKYHGPMTDEISEQFKDLARSRALETLRAIYAARIIQPTLNEYFGLKTASPPKFNSVHEKSTYLRAIKLTAEGVREFSV